MSNTPYSLQSILNATYDQETNSLRVTGDGGGGSIDTSLDVTSTRAVQNKAIATAVNQINTKLDTVETGAQKNKIESISLNGTDFSIDSATKKASGTITTCYPFPTGTIKNGTTLQLCDSLIETGEAKVGMMFMETITLSDSPSGGRAEVLVRVMGTGVGDEVLYLEMHSTNTDERNWYTMWYNGSMEWGDTDCPWFASLLIPKASYNPSKRCGDPLYKEYMAASQQYVEDNISTHNSSNSAHNSRFNLKEDKNAAIVTVPSATSAFTLSEGNFYHCPSVASTYTLPNVTDSTVTHQTVIEVYFENVNSVQFASSTPYEYDKSINIALGDVWKFICSWRCGGWRIYPLKMKKPEITATTTVAISGTAGIAISETSLTASSSDHANVSFSSSNLPSGITLSNGKLNGTIATSGTYNSTVVASAPYAASVNISVTFTIS